MPKRLIFLYSEIAGYVLASVRALAEHCGCEVELVHWPVNSEAPFELPEDSRVRLTDRQSLTATSLAALLDRTQPDAIIVSGWMDRGYVEAVRPWRRRIPVIVGMDNHWTGSLRQRVAGWLSPFFLRRSFNSVWIPGEPQREFARRLGFSDKQTLTGWYSADVDPFLAIPRNPSQANPRLLYVGRYVPQKGIHSLWDAYQRFCRDYPAWELHCIGTGSEWANRREAPGIVHHGFCQPADLAPHIAGATAFVMPSLWEPWGVVLHEMTAAGLPVIVSRAVGAATQFLKDGQNGFLVPVADTAALENAFRRLAALPAESLTEMARRSVELAGTLTPTLRAERLISFLRQAG